MRKGRCILRIPKWLPYALIFPAVTLLLVFRIFPLFYTVGESVWIDSNFTLEAYQKLFSDGIFHNAFLNTFKIGFMIIPVQIVVSMALALLVNTQVRGVGVFRTLYFLPFAMSAVVSYTVWNLILSPTNGLANSIIGAFHIAPQRYFDDPAQVLWCIVGVTSWVGCGYWMLFLLSGLKGIDQSVYESAKIDGAGFFGTLFKITLPLMKKSLLFVTVANTTSNLLIFTPMKLITDGGPMGASNTLMYESYKAAFGYGNRVRSAAIITILLIIVGLICIFQFYLMREKDQ